MSYTQIKLITGASAPVFIDCSTWNNRVMNKFVMATKMKCSTWNISANLYQS